MTDSINRILQPARKRQRVNRKNPMTISMTHAIFDSIDLVKA